MKHNAHPKIRALEIPESSMSNYLIICPTPRGGHIEHAADLAVALARVSNRPVFLASRPGASEYLQADLPGVTLVECIPALVNPTTGQLSRRIQMTGRLIFEHIALRRLVKKNQTTKIISEEPRYPLPGILSSHRGPSEFTLILHNVVEHGAHSQAMVKTAMRTWCIRRSTRVVVHGTEQMAKLSDSIQKKTVSVPLPSGTALEFRPSFSNWLKEHEGRIVCLGEIRENKGIEKAIAACVQANLPLSIIGAPIDNLYAKKIQHMSTSDSLNITFRFDFVERGEFDQILTNSRAVVLPYQSLSAQSGVLARAIDLSVPVIAFKLPALVEQAAGNKLVTFVKPGDVAAMSKALSTSQIRRITKSAGGNHADWDDVANTVR